MLEESDRHWLAGLLEGEGSFFLQKTNTHGRYYYYPRITVVMTDLDVIERVAKLFDNNVYVMPPSQMKKPHYLQQYRATLTGSKARAMMVEIEPLMGQRRKSKIQEILSYGPGS